jgi:hypothetical protein
VKLRHIYLQNTPRTILLRGLFALLAGLLIGAAYTAFTGQNGIVRFAGPIFCVPTALTILNLLFGRSQPTPSAKAAKEKGSETKP